MAARHILIAIAPTTVSALATTVATAQVYTPAEGFYDLSAMPETGMYPQGGAKPGSGGGSGPPLGQGEITMQDVVATVVFLQSLRRSFASILDLRA
jgi:hypothetical protein